VDMVSTSEVSVSLTIDNTTNLDAILTELRPVLRGRYRARQAIVCLVGENIRYTPAWRGACSTPSMASTSA